MTNSNYLWLIVLIVVIILIAIFVWITNQQSKNQDVFNFINNTTNDASLAVYDKTLGIILYNDIVPEGEAVTLNNKHHLVDIYFENTQNPDLSISELNRTYPSTVNFIVGLKHSRSVPSVANNNQGLTIESLTITNNTESKQNFNFNSSSNGTSSTIHFNISSNANETMPVKIIRRATCPSGSGNAKCVSDNMDLDTLGNMNPTSCFDIGRPTLNYKYNGVTQPIRITTSNPTITLLNNGDVGLTGIDPCNV